MAKIDSDNFWAEVQQKSQKEQINFNVALMITLKENIHLINHYDSEGYSLLSTAIGTFQFDSVKILIQCGANIFQPVCNPIQYLSHQHIHCIEWARIQYECLKDSPLSLIKLRAKEILEYLEPFEIIEEEVKHLDTVMAHKESVTTKNKI